MHQTEGLYFEEQTEVFRELTTISSNPTPEINQMKLPFIASFKFFQNPFVSFISVFVFFSVHAFINFSWNSDNAPGPIASDSNGHKKLEWRYIVEPCLNLEWKRQLVESKYPCTSPDISFQLHNTCFLWSPVHHGISFKIHHFQSFLSYSMIHHHHHILKTSISSKLS